MIVTDAAFPYLVAQKGGLDELKRDRAAWEQAYAISLAHTLANITPYLPPTCGAILDVGGGMGGIDALLNAQFGGDCEVSILDGADDPPVMTRHAETFNDSAVARDFLLANGVDRFMPRAPGALGGPKPYDLIVSFGSWGFHYAPAAYLPFVKACCHPDTVLILEVRRGKPSWLASLYDAFGRPETAFRSDKFDRLVFRA